MALLPLLLKTFFTLLTVSTVTDAIVIKLDNWLEGHFCLVIRSTGNQEHMLNVVEGTYFRKCDGGPEENVWVIGPKADKGFYSICLKHNERVCLGLQDNESLYSKAYAILKEKDIDDYTQYWYLSTNSYPYKIGYKKLINYGRDFAGKNALLCADVDGTIYFWNKCTARSREFMFV